MALAEANEATFSEFEATDRLEWAKAKIELLRQLVKPKEEKTAEPVTETKNGSSEAKKPSEETKLASPIVPNHILKSPKIDVNELLPEKPKSDFLNIPSTLPKSAKQGEKSSLQFSDSIQSEHDSLTEELIQTVRLIRRNNLHLRDMVKADDQVLDEATTLLSGNADKIQSEGRKLKNYSRTVWMTTWRMLSLMFFAVLLFLFAYLFIRLT